MSPKEVRKEAIEEFPNHMQDNSGIPDNQQVIQKMTEYRPADPREVKNADPEFGYRWLSKEKIRKNGGNTRGWEIVQGNDHECSSDPGSAMVLKQAGCDVDTTRSLGDLILGKARKEWIESRRKFHDDQSRQAVKEVTVHDEKERSERTMEYLRKDLGMSKHDAERFVQCHGGAVMNTHDPIVMTGRR